MLVSTWKSTIFLMDNLWHYITWLENSCLLNHSNLFNGFLYMSIHWAFHILWEHEGEYNAMMLAIMWCWQCCDAGNDVMLAMVWYCQWCDADNNMIQAMINANPIYTCIFTTHQWHSHIHMDLNHCNVWSNIYNSKIINNLIMHELVPTPKDFSMNNPCKWVQITT